MEEYESVTKNNVWEVVPIPTDKLVVGSRWIFKVKKTTDGSIEKYKARFWPMGTLKWRGLTMRRPFVL